MHKVHNVQSKRTPEAWQAAQDRIEQARQHTVSWRKCKAVKGHAVRHRMLNAEGLQQMSERPDELMAIQARVQCAQQASKSRQATVMRKADEALSKCARLRTDSPEPRLSDADEEEDEAMMEVAQLVGTADVRRMADTGREGVGMLAPSNANRGSGTIQSLLQQLRTEPKDDAEQSAKFLLYSNYSEGVEEMRHSLFKFYEESRPTVPGPVATDMDKQIKGIDSTRAMGIPDDAREWFVYHMMRQAERNNLNMANILESFEKKLEFLASNDQVECPVCLETFEEHGMHAAETLGCCHKVCKDCWTNWSAVMHGRPFCPLCRNDEFLGAIAEHLQ